MNPNNQNLSPLGQRLIGFWTRKKLDTLAKILKLTAWLFFYIGHFLKWRTMQAVLVVTEEKIKIIGSPPNEKRIARLSKVTDRREMREAKFKLWTRRRLHHNYPWGKEDYRRILMITQQARRNMIRSLASSLCGDCYGKGELGWNEMTETYIICRCVKQNLIKMKEQKK